MNEKLMKLGLAALGAGCLFTWAGCDADAPSSAHESLEGESGMHEDPPQDPDEESGSECGDTSTPSTLADKDTIVDLSASSVRRSRPPRSRARTADERERRVHDE